MHPRGLVSLVVPSILNVRPGASHSKITGTREFTCSPPPLFSVCVSNLDCFGTRRMFFSELQRLGAPSTEPSSLPKGRSRTSRTRKKSFGLKELMTKVLLHRTSQLGTWAL